MKAGPWAPLRKLGQGVVDPDTRRAIESLEAAVLELQARLADAERRLKAGGL